MTEDLRSLLVGGAIHPDVQAALRDDLTQWAIPRELACFLARLVQEGSYSSVLEYGAGQSSIILARALALAGGGRLTSVDHEERYCRSAWQEVRTVARVEAQLLLCPLRLRMGRAGLYYRYAGAAGAIRARGPYDLVLIDGPPGAYGRDAPLHDAYQSLRPGGLVVLDDAARVGEQAAIRRWLSVYPGLNLVLFDTSFGRGIAVLRHDGNKQCRFRIRALLESFQERWVRFDEWRRITYPSICLGRNAR